MIVFNSFFEIITIQIQMRCILDYIGKENTIISLIDKIIIFDQKGIKPMKMM